MTRWESTRVATERATETWPPEFLRGSCFLSDRMRVTEEEWQSLLEEIIEVARTELRAESFRAG
ncbi:hypothetical protein [Rhizobium sp. NFACC06-2]|uniref:hypothetical protein n=1 Tax=Rhizobium sp. NFACC06-2 TaxID=1566264 RepID=UPI000876D9C7|nr:hypothetical protein [Rhizobium sp. NFACC06-2]SCY90368.1 hypothetical protein SAMN03159288_05095 [Rhizobium sp. NFACC06-2]